jgi:hypothetical protein
MYNLEITECDAETNDTTVCHYFFTARNTTTDDICDSSFLTMYPSVLAHCIEDEFDTHPQAKIATYRYRNLREGISAGVPENVLKKYINRRGNIEYIETLSKLQEIYDSIIEEYEKGFTKSSKGIVVGNFYNSPWHYNLNAGKKPFSKEKDMNPLAFQAVKYFIALQKLSPSKPIPKYITKFFEQYEALKLLES